MCPCGKLATVVVAIVRETATRATVGALGRGNHGNGAHAHSSNSGHRLLEHITGVVFRVGTPGRLAGRCLHTAFTFLLKIEGYGARSWSPFFSPFCLSSPDRCPLRDRFSFTIARTRFVVLSPSHSLTTLSLACPPTPLSLLLHFSSKTRA